MWHQLSPHKPLSVYPLHKWGGWNNQGSAIGVISWHRESQLVMHPHPGCPCLIGDQPNWGGDAPPHLLFLGSAGSTPDKLLPLLPQECLFLSLTTSWK